MARSISRLAIEDVSVDFGGIRALTDVSFALESGSIVGLIGPNGAGKSTLLNCISGITRPARGRVRLGDTVLSTLSASSVAHQGIGRVFQHPELVAEEARAAFAAGTRRSLIASVVYVPAILLAFVSPTASFALDGLVALYFALSRSEVPGLIHRAAIAGGA